MRYLISLIILCLLPLQWSYAAVAEYCQHEEVVSAQDHLGHHQHQHADEAADDENPQTSSTDRDCPGCHHSTPGAMVTASAQTSPQQFVAPGALLSQSIPDRSPENPFRPPLAADL